MYQYMRIQGRENSYVTGYPKGVFSLCWNLIRDKALTEEEEKLFISIDGWFKENLPEPEPCKNHEAVITFFKYGSTAQMLENEEYFKLFEKIDAATRFEDGGTEG